MNIEALTLHTRSIAQQRAFYGETLGLNIEKVSDDALTLRAGSTRLSFVQDGTFDGGYHFAFNIPENQFDAARVWLEERAELLADGAGEKVFFFEDWNAHSAYFRDADGNIAELIARHSLPSSNNRDTDFDANEILNVSELGLPVAAVPGAVRDLRGQFGLALYGESSETFAPLGNEEGLLIVVPTGRHWFPTGTPAQLLPFHLRARTERGVFELKEPAWTSAQR